MSQNTTNAPEEDEFAAEADQATHKEDKEAVEREQGKLSEFVRGLSGDDIKSGTWFTNLLAHSLNTYTTKVDWEYFQRKYAGVPADAIVDQRIKMAARYTALEGGLSAAAYTAAIAATIGTLGGASPATVPAAVATVMVDVAFTTQLQLRLAYDIAVLYRVPLDLDDPDDMWKLVRVAFTIKGGEVARDGVIKVVPIFVRPIVKRFYKGAVLTAGRSLPVVGRFLLQRNMIKIGIPLVGVPLSVVLNRYTTLVAGRHASAVFRNEARLIELAARLSSRTRHPETLLWTAWLVVKADQKISDDEAALMRHLVLAVRRDHHVVDGKLAHLVDLDPGEVWSRIAAEEGPLDDLVAAALRIAECDGQTNTAEKRVLTEIRERCRYSGSVTPDQR